MSNNICIYPTCREDRHSRGLCVLHYQQAYRLVSRGSTTWDKLEKKGRALSSRRVKKEVENWFLKGEKPHGIHRIREN